MNLVDGNGKEAKEQKHCIPAMVVAKGIGILSIALIAFGIMGRFPKTRIIFFCLALAYVAYLYWQYKNPCPLPGETIDFEAEAHRLWLQSEIEESRIRQMSDKNSNEGNSVNKNIIEEFTVKASYDFVVWLDTEKKLNTTVSTAYRAIILEVLLHIDKQAELPSVSSNYLSDPENERLSAENTFVLLREINILDHTLNVVSEIYKLAEERFGDDLFKIHVCPLLIVAMGHDLGKITRQKNSTDTVDNKRHHAIISYEIMEMILEPYDIDPKTKKHILNAILQHHPHQNKIEASTPLYCELLIEADRRARRLEVASLTALEPTTKEPIERQAIAPKPVERNPEWHKDVVSDLRDFLWNIFSDAASTKLREIYFFEGNCYFGKDYFELKITSFFTERKLPNFYEQQSFGIKADNNIEFVTNYFRQQKISTSSGEYSYTLIDVQYKGRWKTRIPVYGVKASFICQNMNAVKDLVRLSPMLNAITNIITSQNKDKET